MSKLVVYPENRISIGKGVISFGTPHLETPISWEMELKKGNTIIEGFIKIAGEQEQYVYGTLEEEQEINGKIESFATFMILPKSSKDLNDLGFIVRALRRSNHLNLVLLKAANAFTPKEQEKPSHLTRITTASFLIEEERLIEDDFLQAEQKRNRFFYGADEWVRTMYDEFLFQRQEQPTLEIEILYNAIVEKIFLNVKQQYSKTKRKKN